MKLNTKKLLMSWISYVIVCAFLTFVNYTTTPHNWWVVWVIAGWGLGQLLSTCRYFLYGSDEDEQTNKLSQ